jgi:lactoylglutathione lyase
MYISVVTLPVSDVDRAIDFYTKKLGWTKTMDMPMGEDSRWVTVAPSGGQTAFTLSTDSDKAIGSSGIVIEVDDVHKFHEQLTQAGVAITEPPRNEPWGGWAMFKDSEGNVHGLHSPIVANVGSN